MLSEKQLDERIHRFIDRKMEEYPELRVVDILSTNTLSDSKRSPLYHNYNQRTDIRVWRHAHPAMS